MIPGLSAHMPEIIQYTDENDYDAETYIQIFNCMGFLMQVEIESVIRVIHSAKKPVLTIKPCAAGRVTPFVGLNFNWNVLRPQDMIFLLYTSSALRTRVRSECFSCGRFLSRCQKAWKRRP